MQRSQHDVEPLQHVIVEVEGAVGHDVDFDAVEDLDTGDFAPKRFDLRTLLRHLFERQPAARPGTLRVVGDGHVLVTELLGGAHHRVQGVTAVAPIRMRVQITADMSFEHERGNRVAVRGVDFRVAGAEFRRDERQVEIIVQLVFRWTAHRPTGCLRQLRVLELQASRDRTLLKRLDMRWRAGMPDQRGARIVGNRQMNGDRTTLRHDFDAAVIALVGDDGDGQPSEARQNSAVLRRDRNREHLNGAHGRFVAAKIAHRYQCVDCQPGAPRFFDNDRGELMCASEWKRVVSQGKQRSYFSTRADRLASMLTLPFDGGDTMSAARVRTGMLLLALAAAGCGGGTTPAPAVEQAAAPVAPSSQVLMQLRSDWLAQKDMMMKIADAMPENKFTYKSTPPQRNYGEQVMHIALSNVDLLKVLGGSATAPSFTAESAKTKADMLKALGDSYDYGTALMNELSEATVLEPVKEPPSSGTLVTRAHHLDVARAQYGYLRTDGCVSAAERDCAAGQQGRVAPGK